MTQKSDRQAEHDRRYGNDGWKPCVPCKAYGAINGQICSTCGGIGFLRRDYRERTAAQHSESK